MHLRAGNDLHRLTLVTGWIGQQTRGGKLQAGFGQVAALELFLPALEQTSAGNALPGDHSHDHKQDRQGYQRHDQGDAAPR